MQTSQEINQRRAWALSFLIAGEILPEQGRHHMVVKDFEDVMANHAHLALQRIGDATERAEVTMEIIKASPHFATTSELVRWESVQHGLKVEGQNLTGNSLLNEDQLLEAQRLVVSQVEAAIRNKLVWKRPKARLYLELCWLWGDEATKDRIRGLVRQMLDSAEDLLLLLEAFLDTIYSRSLGATQSYGSWTLLLDKPLGGALGLSEYISLKTIENALPSVRQYLVEEIPKLSVTSAGELSPQHPVLGRQLICWFEAIKYFAEQNSASPPDFEDEMKELYLTQSNNQ